MTEVAKGCEYGQETHDLTIRIQERVNSIDAEVKRRYDDGCKHRASEQMKIASFEERMKKGDEIFGQLIIKVDYLTKEVVTLGVKFEEAQKRADKNSRILWALVTAVIVQLIAFGLSFLKR